MKIYSKMCNIKKDWEESKMMGEGNEVGYIKIPKKNIMIFMVLVMLVMLLKVSIWGNGGGKVEAVVNGEVITGRDIDEYNDNFRGGIVQRVVMDELMKQKAREMGVEVSEKEVEDRLQEIKNGVKDDKEFHSMLKEQGINENGLRINIENVIYSDKLMEKVRQSIEIPEGDIKSAYELEKDNFVNIDVKFAVFGDKGKAEEFKKKLSSGVFGDVVAEYGDYVENSGSLEYITRRDEVLGDKVLGVKKGDVIGKENDELGKILVFKVMNKREKLDELTDYIKYVISDAKKYEEFEKVMNDFVSKSKVEYR